MSKQCSKCSKAMANRHIGMVCTDCKGVFYDNAPRPLSRWEQYSQWVNKTLTNKGKFLTYPEWLKGLSHD